MRGARIPRQSAHLCRLREHGLAERSARECRGVEARERVEGIALDVGARHGRIEEAEIEGRWATLEADSELREIKLEQREKTVGELELRLGKKESDLAEYVGQLQTQMDQRESDWWGKQLGKPVAAGD